MASKSEKVDTIVRFLMGEDDKYCQFGSLVCKGNRIYTDGVLLAWVHQMYDAEKNLDGVDVHLNTKTYSKTSTAHKNLVELATTSSDIPNVYVRLHSEGLPEIFE